MAYLSIVIPAYNEASRLGPSLSHIGGYLRSMPYSHEVIVVDNASTDGTTAVALQHAGVHVVQEPTKGKGAAVRTGILAAEGDFLLFSDADLSTPIEAVGDLLAALEHGADIAIASRDAPGAVLAVPQPLHREAIGRFGNLLVRMLAVRGVADTQCGFKLFPRHIARSLFSAQLLNGIAFDIEVLFLAQRWGYRIAEVPVTWTDSPDSRIDPFRDSLGALRDLARIRWNYLIGRYRPPAGRLSNQGGRRRYAG